MSVKATALSIVGQLSEIAPLNVGHSGGYITCVFCKKTAQFPPPIFPHDEGCCWLRARRLTDRLNHDG